MVEHRIKYIELTFEELSVLKYIYENKCCPKKCHIGEKRIWFVPKILLDTVKNLEYTCCLDCFYNKENMNLFNGKYKREDLVPILCEGLDCNCDESTNIESVSYKLPDDYLLSIYESGNNSGFLRLNKIDNNEFNIYFDKICTDNISIVIYKLMDGNNENDMVDNLDKVLYVKIKEFTDDNNNPSINVTKSYLHNNEFGITLNKLIKSIKIHSKYKLISNPLKFNFKKTHKYSLDIEYSNSYNLENTTAIKLNFINNKTKNRLNDDNYKEYIMRELYI